MVRGRSIFLSGNSYLGIFELCDDISITVGPLIYGSGLFLTVRRPSATKFLWIARYTMLFFIGAAFIFLFRSGKHFSVLRSVLVIQVCCFFMLDPLHILFELFHSISFLHSALFVLFWWRGTSEVFLQYCPLIRQQPTVYRSIIAIPAAFFLATAVFNSQFLATAALFTVPVVGVLGIIFLVKVGNTQGKVALVVHIVAGAGTMIAVLLVNVCRIVDSSLRDEFICQTVEITVLGSYALFQMIFQMGERNDEAEEHLAKPKKYEKIEEMLEALTHMDEEVRFALTDS
jgi:hypothetical protein